MVNNYSKFVTLNKEKQLKIDIKSDGSVNDKCTIEAVE